MQIYNSYKMDFLRVICDSLPQVGVMKMPFQPAVYLKYPLPLHPREECYAELFGFTTKLFSAVANSRGFVENSCSVV